MGAPSNLTFTVSGAVNAETHNLFVYPITPATATRSNGFRLASALPTTRTYLSLPKVLKFTANKVSSGFYLIIVYPNSLQSTQSPSPSRPTHTSVLTVLISRITIKISRGALLVQLLRGVCPVFHILTSLGVAIFV